LHDDDGDVIYKKDKYTYFIFNNKTDELYYDYERVYLILKENFKFNDKEINNLLIKMLWKILKIKVRTTKWQLHLKN